MLSFKVKDDFWLWSYMSFCILKYISSGKNNNKGKLMQIWIRNTAFFLADLRICDLRT
jgi:hypothetical protein